MSTHIRFDWAMKRLLRQKTNFVILEGFLSELLEEKIIIHEILESEGNKEDTDDKYNRVDILVKNIKDELMLIEVQNQKEYDFSHRMNYGQAKLLTEYIHEGEDYDKLKKIYSINIVYFDLGQGSDYVYKGKTEFVGIHNNEILELSEKQKNVYSLNEVSSIFTTYYLLKVNNFDNVAKKPLDEWIYFLKNSEIKENFKAQGLKEAKEKLRLDNLNDAQKVSYKHFVKSRRIMNNEIVSAQIDGYSEAEKIYKPILEQERQEKEQKQKELEQERLEKEQKQKELEQERQEKEQKQKELKQERQEKELFKIKIVKKLKEKGYTNEEIAEDVEMSITEINAILNN